MFFKFCSENVTRVGASCCSALAEIIEKFNDDLKKQQGIVKVVRNRFARSKTFRKRQLFVMMCEGKMMMNKENFEKYFKYDFLCLVNDRVPNVRIAMSKVLRHHFLKEINGAFVYDQEVNDAVRVLKQDKQADVRFNVEDIETYPVDDKREVTL